MNAIIVRTNKWYGWVLCPYCAKTHRHGIEGFVNGWRSSHCASGEYKCVPSVPGNFS